MQLQIQRPDLIPQPIQLLRELVGRHVVLRAPHRARVGEAQLLRALVRQLDEARVVLPHRRRDRVPAFPDLAQPLLVARGRHDLGDVVDVQAVFGLLPVRCTTCPCRRSPRACAMIVVSSSASFGSAGVAITSESLSRFSCRRWSAGTSTLVVTASRPSRTARSASMYSLVDARAERLGVVGDEVLLRPSRPGSARRRASASSG